MTVENQETTKEGAAPEATAPKPEPKAETKVSPPAKAKEEIAKPEKEDPGPKAKQIGEEDDIPEDADLLQLSKKALNARLLRHTKKELRERFGTDDLDDV